ncbi:MAG TPA: hypothetical protein VK806_02280 [Bacteroidia bacterium]|jgi:hypothetical protein|nr:hypothetical protein [Bacteroidia bacterium]
MTFKKTFKRMVAGICLSMLSCSPPVIYKSMWQNTPVTVDGKATEWQIPLQFYDAKTKLSFSISNDMTNLYICIRATDDVTEMGILHTGMQLWIDTACKKNHQIGIQFPIVQREQGTASSGHGSRQHSSEEANSAESTASAYADMPDTGKINRMHKHFLNGPKQMRIIGFNNIPDGLLELPSIYPINVSIGWDNSGAMIYEAAIPINTIYKKPFTASDSNKILGLSFNVTVTIKHGTGGDRGGHGGGGMGGGMRGGGMGGGGMGGHGGSGGGSGEASPEQLTVWTEFRLATK